MTEEPEDQTEPRTVVMLTPEIYEMYRKADVAFIEAMRTAGETNVITWIGLIAIHRSFSEAYQQQLDAAVAYAKSVGPQLETMEPQGHA